MLAIPIAAASLCLPQQNPPQSPLGYSVQVNSQEVILDFLAFDQHGRIVSNLRPTEVEVFDNGKRQDIRTFKYVTEDGKFDTPTQNVEGSGGAGANSGYEQIRLVSFVLGELSVSGRSRALTAIRQFLDLGLDSQTYVGIFAIDPRVHLLLPYTNQTEQVRAAIRMAGNITGTQYASEIERQVASLNRGLADPEHFHPLREGSAEERGPSSSNDRFSRVDRMVDSVTLSILASGAGNLAMDALLRMIEAQRALPGRKVNVFFSEGLITPPEQSERLREIVSAANRANVVFYTRDPAGLDTLSSSRQGRLLSRSLNSVDSGGAAAKPTDFKENLRTLAIDTGGFSVTDTNDLSTPIIRIRSEIRGHYEASYTPAAFRYDGRFRPILMRVSRPGIRIRTRSGYFALPIVGNKVVAPFETAGLLALGQQPLPAAFEFHAAVSAFRPLEAETECEAVFSIPTAVLQVARSAGEFHLHSTFVGLIRDSQGEVVQKISRDLLFHAPTDREDDLRRGETVVNLPFRVRPGRYVLEAVAQDVETRTASARRISFFVPSPASADELPISDLVLARASEPIAERDPFDPLQCDAGKVVPESGRRTPQGIYLVLYPESGPMSQLEVSVVHNGAVRFVFRPQLPNPDTDGSIRVLLKIPFQDFEPGLYEVKAMAQQGNRIGRRTVVAQIQ